MGMKSILGIVWENTTPVTEIPRIFCAGIGPLQLGVVLVFSFFFSMFDVIYYTVNGIQDSSTLPLPSILVRE